MKNHCQFVPFTLGKIVLSCPYGKITKLFPDGYGINSWDQDIRDACLVRDEFKNELCAPVIDSQSLIKEFHEKCVDKFDCLIDTKEGDSFKSQLFPNAKEILADSSSKY